MQTIIKQGLVRHLSWQSCQVWSPSTEGKWTVTFFLFSNLLTTQSASCNNSPPFTHWWQELTYTVPPANQCSTFTQLRDHKLRSGYVGCSLESRAEAAIPCNLWISQMLQNSESKAFPKWVLKWVALQKIWKLQEWHENVVNCPTNFGLYQRLWWMKRNNHFLVNCH